MAGTRSRDGTVLALLPFLVRGALSLRVLRDMRGRGLDVAVAFTHRVTTMEPDPADDLRAAGCVIDLSEAIAAERREALDREIRRRGVGVVLQIGATPLYHELPYVKERHPRVTIADTLYNDVGHVVNHFMYERCFDGVIVESEYMKRYVERCSSKRDPGIALVESGIDVEAFTPGPRPSRGRDLVIGYVGRMSPEKNPFGFIELCERVHDAVAGTTFRMVGSGPIAEEVQGAVRGSVARDAIAYRGFQPDLVSELRALDVLVVPSKLDGRPNVVMEANACGVPVIAAPVGGIPELIEEGKNGHLVDPRDAARVVELVRGWAESPDALAALKASSRAAAEARFDQRRMMDRYEAVLRGFARGA